MTRYLNYHPAGMRLEPDFMSSEFCDELRSFGHSAPATAAEVATIGGTRQDDRLRRTNKIDVSEKLVDTYTRRLRTCKSEWERYFGIALGKFEPPQLLAYQKGGHFSAHRDTDDHPGYPLNVRSRVLSVVLFLNSPSLALGENVYGGGTLTFFDLSETVSAGDCRIPVVGQSGMLVAFPSNWIHCVTPVQHGTRWTLVTWFAGD